MLTADRIVGGLVLLKACDVAVRGPVELPAPLWAAVLALWAAGGLGLLTGPVRLAVARAWWGAVLLAGAGIAVDYPLELYRQHLVLLMAMALGALVARDDRERLLLWRVQLTALYGVAALAKSTSRSSAGTCSPARWSRRHCGPRCCHHPPRCC